MKLLIAPDSFKGSLGAKEVCDTIEAAARSVMPSVQCQKLPVSDGGEGMVEALLTVVGGRRVRCAVRGPLGEPVGAAYGILEDGTAVIEMAAASGLPLVSPEKRNPMVTSTYGTGEMIAHALERGAKKIILGIGGSATSDGGTGAAAALGMAFFDSAGKAFVPAGGNLLEIEGVSAEGLLPALADVSLTIACDVNNPLCGDEGAAAIYGPQKGADAAMIAELDRGLSHLADKLCAVGCEDLRALPGMGAAGGFSLPFAGFLGARLSPGLEIVLDYLNFDTCAEGADLIITGEGCTDYQSAMGKVLSGVCRHGRAKKVPVIALSGALGEGYEALYELGLTAAFSTCTAVKPLAWQMENAEVNLYRAAVNLFRLIAGTSVLGA